MILQKRDGDDWVFEATDRNAGGARTEAFRINGITGAVTVGGVALGPYALQAAFTQTYATAARTVPAATTHTITDSSGGAASTTTIAAITTGGAAADQVPTRNAIATLAAELALAEADIVALKKVVNALIDSLQAVGIVG